MLRWSELFLLLPPLVLAGVVVRTRAMPSGRLLAATLAAILVMAVGVMWYGTDRAVDGAYVPARLQDGRVLPGHGAG